MQSIAPSREFLMISISYWRQKFFDVDVSSDELDVTLPRKQVHDIIS